MTYATKEKVRKISLTESEIDLIRQIINTTHDCMEAVDDEKSPFDYEDGGNFVMALTETEYLILLRLGIIFNK